MADKKSHHAHKLCRLLTKLAIANEIGPEATLMLMVIAHTEDAIWYSGPVTFWNQELQTICGLKSTGRLIRAREKAVDGGWLIYEKGAKERPAKYQTRIPDRYRHIPDVAVGDQATSGMECTRNMEENPERIRKESDKNPKSCGKESDKNPKTFNPVPVPVPVPKKRAKRTCVSYTEEFELFWKAYPPKRRTGKKSAAKAYAVAIDQVKAESGISQDEAAEALQAACERFAASAMGNSQYVPGPTPWLNQGRWNDAPESWDNNGESHETNKRPPERSGGYDCRV
jgi:hypothetical protein